MGMGRLGGDSVDDEVSEMYVVELGGVRDWLSRNYPFLMQAGGSLLQLWGQYEMYQRVSQPKAQATYEQMKQAAIAQARSVGAVTPEQKQAMIDAIASQFPADKQPEIRAELAKWIGVKRQPPVQVKKEGTSPLIWLALGAGALMLLRR